MIAFFLKFCVLSVILMSLLVFYVKRLRGLYVCCCPAQSSEFSRKWVIIVIALCVVLYSIFAYVISLSWVKSDEWIFIISGESSVRGSIHIAIDKWLHNNGRFGDIFGAIFGLSLSRWQHIFLTPIFIVGAPFAVYALVRNREERHLFNLRGFFFVLFFITILAISVNTSPWRNYYDYAAAINYLWPCTVISFFLSFFRSDFWSKKSDSKWRAFFLTILGVYCGWSLECIALFFTPLLLLWFIHRCYKKLYVPCSCFWGLCGFMLGAFLLVSSPGMDVRGAGEMARCAVDVSAFSFEEAFEFVCNHSPENMQKIKGGSVDFYIKGLPLILRPFYFPELISRFISCCYPLMLVTLLLFVMSVKEYGCRRNKIPIISLLIVLLSITCASSYLYGCVPSKMSYLPAIFIMAVACSYLYIKLFSKYSFICRLVSVGAIAAFCVTIFPSALEAIDYKQYGREVRKEMYIKIRKGEKDAHIPPVTYQVAPKNKIGLITDAKHLY